MLPVDYHGNYLVFLVFAAPLDGVVDFVKYKIRICGVGADKYDKRL